MELNIVAMGLTHLSDAEISFLASSVITSMTGNILLPDPNPTLLVAGDVLTTFNDAKTAWGPPGNHGSAQQHRDLLDARVALEVVLTQLAFYAENKLPGDRTGLGTVSWPLRKISEPVGPLSKAQNFRQAVGKTIPSGAVKTLWNLPDGVKQGAVKAWRVMHSLTADPNSATQLAVTTKASYIDLEAGNRPSNFYWVIPVGTAGDGAISDVLAGFATGPVIS